MSGTNTQLVCSGGSCHLKRNLPCRVLTTPSYHQSQDQELGTVSMGTVTSSLQFRTTETCLHASLIRALPLVRSWGLQSLGVGSFGPLGIEKPAATLFQSRCVSPYHAALHTGGSRPRGLQL